MASDGTWWEMGSYWGPAIVDGRELAPEGGGESEAHVLGEGGGGNFNPHEAGQVCFYSLYSLKKTVLTLLADCGITFFHMWVSHSRVSVVSQYPPPCFHL